MSVEAVLSMKKLLFGSLVIGLSAMAFAGNRDGHGDKPQYAMPEPGAVVELAACAVGLGVWAWRRR